MSFLFSAMTNFDMLEEFLRMVKILFLGAKACDNLHGALSDEFT